jgi:transcriptional regulator with XRE-family HTH domain
LFSGSLGSLLMAAKSKNIVGERVKQARLKHKPPLTQDELSGRLSRLGVSIDRAGIAKIETGIRHVVDYELKVLAKVLGVSVDWLLGAKE